MLVPTSLGLLVNAWRAPQVLLPKVIRWQPYLDLRPSNRPQDCLQHTASITLLGIALIGQLRPYILLDEGLLLSAFTVHDLGEGELGSDTPWSLKNYDRDLKEYRAFRTRYEEAMPGAFPDLHKAFLLQFCLSNPENFPDDAREIMRCLAQNRFYSALAFEATERLDYILYAFEQARDNEDARILFEVLDNQMPLLDKVAERLPGFRDAIWTTELTDWFHAFQEQYAAAV